MRSHVTATQAAAASTAHRGAISMLLALLVALFLALFLAACQTPPAAPAPVAAPSTWLTPEQQDVLRGLGFTEDDAGWTLITPGRLLFAVDSDVLMPALHTKVDAVARSLHKVGIDRFRVEGHTDDQGAAAYNQALSLRRANAVAQVLVEAGIAPTQVSTVGYGFSRPLQQGSSAAARTENRRVAIVVPVP